MYDLQYHDIIGYVYEVQSHFQQYFSYIIAVSFLLEETVLAGENH
jgi:hypothetical protein